MISPTAKNIFMNSLRDKSYKCCYKVSIYLLALILSNIVPNSGFHSLENIGRYLVVSKEEGTIVFSVTITVFLKHLQLKVTTKVRKDSG